MFFFFKKGRSKRNRLKCSNKSKGKCKPPKGGCISSKQMSAIYERLMCKKRLIVYASSM